MVTIPRSHVGMLYVQESYVNATEGHRIGESDVYETRHDTLGDLYRNMMREYGRCTGKVYIDREGESVPVGWVFIGRYKYQDIKETYLREVWVTVHASMPVKTVTYHNINLDTGKAIA